MSQSILIISSEFPPGPGGIGQHAYSLAVNLHYLGYNVSVLSPGDYATEGEVQTFDSVQPFGVERYTRKGVLFTYLSRLTTTYAKIREVDNQTIVITGKFPLWLGIIIKKLYPQINTIAVLHGSEVNLPNPLLRWLTHKSIAAADIIVPVSKFTLSLVPAWIRQQHKKITIIPNGIDQDPFPELETDSTYLKGHPCLLTVGHVSPRKGQHRVIKALPTILNTYPDTHYHIVGRPKNKSALQNLANKLGVTNNITFHGRVPDHKSLGNFYRQADIFMLLSENQPNGDVEGFGIVALEANLHGLPVVGAKFCGVEEAVSHLNTGYLVDGDNPSEVLEGITYCLANKGKLRHEAISWANQHRWSEIIKLYHGLIR